MNYLDITIGSLVTDIIIMTLFLLGILESKVVRIWYKKFGFGAVLADVTIIMLGITTTYFLYPYIFSEFSLIKFIGLALLIQIIHDFTFGNIVSRIETDSPILNVFKIYAKNVGVTAIATDSIMIISSILIMTFIKDFSMDFKLNILVLSLYVLTFILYSY
jgi:hypothetical protein